MRATSHAHGTVAGDENGLVASTTNMTSAFRSPVPLLEISMGMPGPCPGIDWRRNKHMKLKMLVGADTTDIEWQVNVWRQESPNCKIIKSETNISYHTIPNLSGNTALQQRI
jgi:hypothetical protein